MDLPLLELLLRAGAGPEVQHDGRTARTVESRPGEGSTFTVELPVGEPGAVG